MEEQIIAIIFLAVILIAWYFYNRKSTGKSVSSGLAMYSRDLTKLAREDKLDIVVGRKDEISRVIQIMSRRTKNNSVLVGKAGVGKTAIAEGLALAIVKRQVPPVLYNKKVLALDLTGILAGTKYRGEFEKRIQKIINEISNANRTIILFIDEIHILAEAGGAEGAINASDILKPLLARGELQVVGATTKDEYEKYIKNDTTLDRRLQPILVSEPNIKQVEEILNGIKGMYEKYHNVTITSSAIKAAIKETGKISSRSYPDKAIDAMDEACSRVRLSAVSQKDIKATLSVEEKDVKDVVSNWYK